MTVQDLKYVWMGLMLVLLASNAGSFVQAREQKAAYSAPWIYPANAPQQ